MAQLFSNNVDTTLASTLSDVATSAALTDGAGLQSPTGGDYELLTLAAAGNYEIVRVTARSTNTVTITRAQEGTTARSWSAGTRVFAGVTAATLTGLRGIENTATGSNAIAFGNDAVAPGSRGAAYGAWSEANGADTVAVGYAIANGARSVAIGEGAIVDADDVRVMAGMPVVARNRFNAASAVRRHSSSSAIVMSEFLNLRTLQSYLITLPANVRFFPDEVGLIFVFQQNSAIVTQPTVQFGIDLSNTEHVDAVETVGLAAVGDRWRPASLKSYDGVTSLRFEITVAATAADWGSLMVRAYWRGFAIEEYPD